MNLVKTLARVAIGAMLARGVGKMIGGRSGASAGAQGEVPGGGSQAGGGLGGLLGGLTGGGSQSGGGLGGLLGGLTGGSSQSGGGLGGLLGGLGGAGAAGGGLAGMLGGLLGGQAGGQTGAQANADSSGSAGGLGGLLDGLSGAPNDGLGGILNQSFGNASAPEPTADQNQHAELMLRAMINAAKSDGQVDAEERQKILEHLADVTREEAEFVHAEMAAPLDVESFVGSVPQGMEQQIYLMSLLAIKLDSQVEAQYLDRIAKGMNIAPADVNAIHARLGLPNLYA